MDMYLSTNQLFVSYSTLKCQIRCFTAVPVVVTWNSQGAGRCLHILVCVCVADFKVTLIPSSFLFNLFFFYCAEKVEGPLQSAMRPHILLATLPTPARQSRDFALCPL